MGSLYQFAFDSLTDKGAVTPLQRRVNRRRGAALSASYFAAGASIKSFAYTNPINQPIKAVGVAGLADVLSELSDMALEDEVVIKAAVERMAQLRCFDVVASEATRDRHQFVLAAVAARGVALRHASTRLRDNMEVVRAAVEQDGYALCHASVRLRDDAEIVRAAVATHGEALCHASYRHKDDEDVVKTAVMQKASALRHASERLQRLPYRTWRR